VCKCAPSDYFIGSILQIETDDGGYGTFQVWLGGNLICAAVCDLKTGIDF